MIEPRTRDHDPEPAHVGEVGQAHPARRMLLAEDHIPAGAVESPPFVNAALQGPAHPGDDLGMPPEGRTNASPFNLVTCVGTA